MTATWEIQKAVFAALTADAALSALITGIFDEVPESQPFPYVVVGEATSYTQDTFANRVRSNTLYIHIWSRYKGNEEVLNIQDNVDRILDRSNLVMNGWVTIMCFSEFAETVKDPDGITRHALVRYRIEVETV